MNPEDRLEARLHSSLISDKLEKEVVDTLAWYRIELMKARREIRDLNELLKSK